jgi:uncharacterized protein (TIGR02217 family)
MTAFMDAVVFPIHVSLGSPGGPDWPAQIVPLTSGHEERNTPWSQPLRYYDAKYGVRTRDELYEVLSLYHVARGRLRGFRFRDWTDYRSGPPHVAPTATDQPLGTGNGVRTAFQLVKRYSVAGEIHDRTITRPYGTTLIAVNGTLAGSG